MPENKYAFPLDVGPMYQICSELPSHPLQRRVLWVGNSYTEYNWLPFMVRNLSLHYGPWAVSPTYCIRGGESLTKHLGNGHAAKLIAEGGWHAVVFQEWSQGTYNNDIGEFLPAVKELAGLAKAQGAEVYLYQTWARKNEPWRLDTIVKGYAEAAKAIGARVLPCGRTWQLFSELMPEVSLHTEDNSHPQPLGTFLAALTQWRVMGGQAFESCPQNIGFSGFTLLELNAAIQKAALEAVEKAVATLE